MGTAPKCRQTEGWEQTGRERKKLLLVGGVVARLLPFLNIPACHPELVEAKEAGRGGRPGKAEVAAAGSLVRRAKTPGDRPSRSLLPC